ncbi:putative ubiquitin-like protein YukD [Clostridium saccharoperbutylacetonicum]|uniref:Uncharacterized protein n=1 Tax=Clostridium saccharoperbutylacetonicum N1-4(HMT) TaxID=931276 RepID=M1MC96_9CLOT|nr:hypothetical protein [Clostridium saccharoperbutylacetonicum]AGF54058.1 hypothetical protein Cspa_c02400 [Clostridium saccharoperbutylacetonicum N1-4(HMT)]NRT59429.1 putative ubiquitin-like protein YukD [Clostridium saccharoperbutylacetonicum]NSB28620.1 putative ubiquitin-like protein YukD [Clostridium saccharoperbutylacetonicum]NSB42112.1 putative ubiquitin-like protein YukD [Clostridium saccharoperbutylacetonicum]
MNIKITIDLRAYRKGVFDISVNSEQIIIECLKIISESQNLSLNLLEINYCKSKREKKAVSVYSSFKESNIYTGDILEFI